MISNCVHRITLPTIDLFVTQNLAVAYVCVCGVALPKLWTGVCRSSSKTDFKCLYKLWKNFSVLHLTAARGNQLSVIFFRHNTFLPFEL